MKTEKINGVKIRCYDNGGKTADRYTAVFMDFPETRPGTFCCVGMSDNPFHPQGVGMHGSAMPGNHLGKRVRLSDMPPDCQELVMRDVRESLN